MRTNHDDWMHQDFEEHPLRHARKTEGWWVAAVASVVAVVGVIAFLGASPSTARLQAAHDRGAAEARIANAAAQAARPAQIAAPTRARTLAQTQARTTESAAQAGAASATATAQDASAIASNPQP